MTIWNRKRGDVNDSIIVELCGIANITGATPLGLARLNGVTVQLAGGVVVQAVAVGDDVKCSVRVPLGGAAGWLSAAAIGEWKYETQVTFMDGSIVTWPGQGYDVINVSEDLGP